MDSVFIKGKSVATTGTDHAGLSKQDKIKPGGKPPAKAYVNVAWSADVVSGACRTFIRGNPIWTEPSVVPKSEDAPNVPGIGDPSGTWCLEATATSTVPNVFVEGQRVIRLGDPTVQNHGNCKGKVVTGAEALAALAEANANGAAAVDDDGTGAGAGNGPAGTGAGKDKDGDGNKKKNEETTWIEIELMRKCSGGNEEPVAGKQYQLLLGGKVMKEGKLDGSGKARVEGIPRGAWTVKFPELDNWEWSPAGQGG